VERTGIRRRHIAAEGEFTSDLGTEAAKRALAAAGLTPADIDLIIVATATPDQTFPAVATVIQHKLGMIHGVAFDVAAVCSGFLYALTVADALLAGGAHNRALVIGAETFSRLLDWEDRSTAVLFGDGAGAVVVEAQMQPGTVQDRGILASRLHSDGRYNELLFVDGGPGSTGTVGRLRMRGKEVFRHAVTNLSSVMGEVLEAASLTPADVAWVVPHQANDRIIASVAKRAGIDTVILPERNRKDIVEIPAKIRKGMTFKYLRRMEEVLPIVLEGGARAKKSTAALNNRPSNAD
jgi:3-oxoacyl-[acyl-carrier-protein] synthase-3